MKIKEAEQALGSTVDEVVTTLKQEGCRGFRNASNACPIATYFRRHCRLWSFAEVQHGGIIHRDPQIMDYNFSEPVREFIRRFDGGEFTELAYEQGAR